MDTETLLKWQEIIDEQIKSGKSINAFCRERKISTGSFFKYRKMLAEFGGKIPEETEATGDVPSAEATETGADAEEPKNLDSEGKHTVCFIDTENVGKDWPSFILKNPGISTFLLFYTTASTGISVPDFMTLLRSDIDIEAISCYTGKNALDFQLITLLGSYAALHPDWAYCILSNDTGYDSVIKFWNDRDISVLRCRVRDVISGESPKKPAAKKDPEPAAEQEKESETEEPDCMPGEIAELMIKHGCEQSEELNRVSEVIIPFLSEEKNNRLTLIYQNFLHLFGNEAGKKMYIKYKKPIYSVLTSYDSRRKTQTAGE